MLITKETDYALRLIRGLSDGKRHTVAMLACSEKVPRQYAYKILKKLEGGQIVAITRGADGGYELAQSLSAVTLYDVMATLGDAPGVAACVSGHDYACPWCESHDEDCRVQEHLLSIQHQLASVLKAHTLREILFDPAQPVLLDENKAQASKTKEAG
ncbi:Rrf2 family transcriptional regulator [Eubacteriaceae bacterium RF-744-FAT-4]|uniref:Rrf2 family transcriptional regulator n=2 Tax=Pseudoramibacter porci TaxID=2606631 RepID=A0A7X2T9S8_9FIRM|nr:Rrf2 family transcriptional regulator [Pseudoramibacter porci]